jgi:hypothetical protein
MAIVQISQITNRLGLNIDLPQLAGAELGWSTDTRQLYIGNGTLEQGAPVIGNTEILTEFSDITKLADKYKYTYQGTAAGYIVQTGPTPGTPVALSLQNWLDQFASVLDFGATGDGLTDDTAAINRALNQLYCIQTNPQIRRSLFFPAGVYKVSSPINIPSYATLYGEGSDNSVIQMVASGGTGTCVAQTADSLQQTGVNIGNNGATPPTDINIALMGFRSLDNTKNIFLAQSVTDSEFHSVGFYGVGTTSTLTSSAANTSCVLFASTMVTTTDLLFDGCRFDGTTYGINTSDITKGITVTNSNFNILYQGVALGTGSIISGGPTGTRITSNVFDNIYSAGIILGEVSLNISGYNIFYDVANHFLGTSNPQQSVIVVTGNNNASVGDMFERSDAYAAEYPRIALGSSISIATTNGSEIQLGSKTVQSGSVATLLENVPGEPYTVGTVFTVDTSTGILSFKVDYSIVQNSTLFRTGTLFVAAASTATIVPVTGATGNGSVATLALSSSVPFNVSSTILVTDINPSSYNGTYIVTVDPLPSAIAVSYTSTITAPYVSGGNVTQYVPNYSDDYVENADLGILLSVAQIGQNVSVQYFSTAADPSQMSYSISYFK